ncbi:MAG: hypothetical protein SGBAC_010333 [Bacillariaceae sp.]
MPSGTITDADAAVHQALSRELRDELELLFEKARSVGLFEWHDEDQTLEEKFLMLVSRFPEEALQGAVLLTAQEKTDSSFSGRLPIHLACDNSAPIGVIRWLLDSDKDKTSILQPDKWGDLPIHTACSRKEVLEVVKLLLECDAKKTSIYIKDEAGSLPIHMACRYNAGEEVIRLLLDSDTKKTSLYQAGVYGQLPLHVACRGGASAQVIQTLLAYDEPKTSVLQEDNVGRLAIHIYLLTNRAQRRDMDTVRYLLEGMFCQRIERIGLENWKQTMYQLLNSLTKSYERDFVTRERLDSICVEIRLLLHRVLLLELVVWKASCLRGMKENGDDDTPSSTSSRCLQQTIEEWVAKNNKSCDPCQFKQELLHLGGADQIIPHVLPFVEDEAIVELMTELN